MNDYKILYEAADKNRNLIFEAERFIWKNPETGFKEWKTSAYLAEKFENLGYKLVKAGNIPGFYTDIETGHPGPKIIIFGELDSLIGFSHPECDKETGAVHSCGHNAQCAALLGIAAALKEEHALDGLCGTIRLCAVPAEELIEIDYRESLRQKGIISYYGGKTEFMRRGYLDDVDLAMMVHANVSNDYDFVITQGCIGCIAKKVKYIGVAAHAGGSPHCGKNALYAATLGLQAVNSLRETFLEQDSIRFHPIITKGGNAVNSIPDEVIIESYVRGGSIEAILRENEKINRALTGAAISMGCKINIMDRPGYHPNKPDQKMLAAAEEAMLSITTKERIEHSEKIGTGCSDIGDVSAVMPTIHPYASGAIGIGHGNNYYIDDPERACVNSAKLQLATIKKLFSNDAALAKEIIAEYKPAFASMDEYFKTMEKISEIKMDIDYKDDGSILVNR